MIESVYTFEPRPNPTLDNLNEYELRSAIASEDRNFIHGTGISILRMAQVMEPERFRRYIEMCRSLRRLTRPQRAPGQRVEA